MFFEIIFSELSEWVRERDAERETQRERHRERDAERERRRERDAERDAERETQRERDAERETQRETQRERRRENFVYFLRTPFMAACLTNIILVFIKNLICFPNYKKSHFRFIFYLSTLQKLLKVDTAYLFLHSWNPKKWLLSMQRDAEVVKYQVYQIHVLVAAFLHNKQLLVQIHW